MTNTSIKDLLWDRRCSEAAVQYLGATEIGRRVHERGQEDDLGGGDLFIVEVGRRRVGYNQQDDFYIIFYVMLM
jgi:hypothetical protein